MMKYILFSRQPRSSLLLESEALTGVASDYGASTSNDATPDNRKILPLVQDTAKMEI